MSETLVIGGGIIGLLVARELADAGMPTTLIEMGQAGQESSWAGSGVLSPLYPWREPEAVTRLVQWSQRPHAELAVALREETGIDVEWTRSGLLVLDAEELARARPWAERHQVELEILDAGQLHASEQELDLQFIRALWLAQVAQVRNPRLVQALRRSLESRITIHEQEEVMELQVEHARVTGVRTTRGTIPAEQVVICTGAWTTRLLEQLGQAPRIQPVRGQILLFNARPGQIHHVSLYREHFLVPRQDGKLLFGSTMEQSGFARCTTPTAREELYQDAVRRVPFLREMAIEDHWSGLRPGAPGGIPYIGAYPGIAGLYCNAGHFQHGLATGPASARLLADLILGRPPILDPNPYALETARSGDPRLAS